MEFLLKNVEIIQNTSLKKGDYFIGADTLPVLERKVNNHCCGVFDSYLIRVFDYVGWSSETTAFVDDKGCPWYYAYPLTDEYDIQIIEQTN